MKYNNQFFTYRKTSIPNEIINDIRQTLDSEDLKWKNATVSSGNSPDGDIEAYLSDRRKCKVSVVENSKIVDFMFSQFNVVNELTPEWNFNLSFFENIQYLKYDEQDHFAWHNDMMVSDEEKPKTRKLSMTLMLSQVGEDYTGGTFEFQSLRAGNPAYKEIDLNYGDILVFPSTMEHRIQPITSGSRKCLVAWAWGPPFK